MCWARAFFWPWRRALRPCPDCRGELRWAISIAALYTIAWFFLQAQHLRYLVPAFPLVALIAAAALLRALESLRSSPRRAALALAGALFVCPSLVIWFASYYNIPERIPFGVIFGLESKDAYRARILSVYPAFAAVGKACSSPSRGVLTILNEYGYLCPAMVAWTAPRASFVYEQASDGAYREMLRKLDIAYVVIDDPSEHAHTLPFVASGFLDRAGEIVYQGRSATAIRLLAPGERPARASRAGAACGRRRPLSARNPRSDRSNLRERFIPRLSLGTRPRRQTHSGCRLRPAGLSTGEGGKAGAAREPSRPVRRPPGTPSLGRLPQGNGPG